MPKINLTVKKQVYSLTEVTALLQVENESRVRYYVKHFGLKVPIRAGKLAFSEKHIEQLKKIVSLRDEEKFTLKGASKNLKQQSETELYEETVLNKLHNIKRILKLLHQNLP